MRRFNRHLLPVVAGIVLAQAARAEDGSSPFSLSGFGSLGAVYHDSQGVAFRRDISQPDGAKAGQASLAQDSMLGVQLTARPGNRLEAALQLVSRNNIDVGYTPQVTWAYAKFKPTQEISLRAGRLGVELYLQGDSAEIGYANLPIRQPSFFYPRTLDGIDADHIRPLGKGNLRLKGMAGSLVGKLIPNGPAYNAAGSKFWGALAEYTAGGWTGWVAGGRYVLNKEMQATRYAQLTSSLNAVPNGGEILSSLSMKERPISYLSTAVAYDAGPLQANLNYFRLSSPHWSTVHTVFAQAGYRLGNFTPYATYSRQYTDRDMTPTGIPWGLSSGTDALNQGIAVAQSALKANQSDIGLGVRYDLSPSSALKFQVDRIRYRDTQNIIDPGLQSEPVDNRRSKGLSLISLALEFVF